MVGEGLAPPVLPEFRLRREFARLPLSRRGWRPRQPACISKNGTSKAPSPTKIAAKPNRIPRVSAQSSVRRESGASGAKKRTPKGAFALSCVDKKDAVI